MSLFPFGLRLGSWDLDSGLSIWFLSLNVDYSSIYKSLKTANKYHLSISQLPLLSQVPLDDLSLSELFYGHEARKETEMYREAWRLDVYVTHGTSDNLHAQCVSKSDNKIRKIYKICLHIGS